MNKLEKLLEFVEDINRKDHLFGADFLENYDYDKAKWIFPGLSLRGCWVGTTNPLKEDRSQGTEAFGPSYLKAAINGAYIIGSDDGGAGCLRNLPTVSIYGPTTFVGNHSFHNDLWNNQDIAKLSKFLLSNGFIRIFENVAHKISADMDRFESGKGEYAPGMPLKIRSMMETIAKYNGRVLLNSYLNETRQTP